MSQRHPGSRKRKQKKDSEPDDIFVAKILEIGNWAEKNRQLLTVLGVIALILVAGGVYYSNYRETLAQQAAQQLEQIHQTVALRDTEGAKDQLATYLQRFEGTPYAGEARLLLGELYLSTDDSEQAIAVLEPMAASPREPIEFQAAMLLAAAFEEAGRADEAEALYLRIADRSKLDFQIQDALAAAARIRAAEGDPEGAVELYERILAELEENAPERGQWEMRIQELETEANV